MSFALPPHPELVLLCGGTQQQRASLRRVHSGTIDPRAVVTTNDVQSLLRWAPRSRAVIVCGELAGIGAGTIKRMLRRHAPNTAVISEEDSPPRLTLPELSPRASGSTRAVLRIASR